MLCVDLMALASKRIFIKKVTIMPKGQSPKVKGSLCNIPILEVDRNCSSLPRPAASNGLVIQCSQIC